VGVNAVLPRLDPAQADGGVTLGHTNAALAAGDGQTLEDRLEAARRNQDAQHPLGHRPGGYGKRCLAGAYVLPCQCGTPLEAPKVCTVTISMWTVRGSRLTWTRVQIGVSPGAMIRRRNGCGLRPSPGQDLLRQVSGLVSGLPGAPVAETRWRLSQARRYHGGITWPGPGLATQMAPAGGGLSRHDLDLGCCPDGLRRKDLARNFSGAGATRA
jgi:hypothetical protein